MRRIVTTAVAAMAVISLVAAWAAPIAAAQQAKQKDLVSGWYRDRAVKYFDFGDNTKLAAGNTVSAAPIYVFIHGMKPDGKPDFVQGQHNIVDVLPGEAGYSDLWQVMLVTVPSSYTPDSIKSKADLDAAKLPITATQMFVNCPIVPAGTTLEGGKSLTQGWAKGTQVFYPDFGENTNAAIPIWVFITGVDANGKPQFVEGQHNIIDAVPSDPGYSALWRVNTVKVPAGYKPDSIRSAADVRASGFEITQTNTIVNCPVTTVSDVVQHVPTGAPAPVAAPNAGTGDAAASSGTLSTPYLLAGALGSAGVLLAGLATAAAVRRRTR
jgi:hypothetical protein